MVTRLRKWGNSLGLRIPRVFAEQARVREGSSVDIEVSDGVLIVRPIGLTVYALDDLLAGVTPDNLPGEVQAGGPTGNEAW